MNEYIEDTIDLQEFIKYYPAMGHNAWVIRSKKREVPILDFLDAVLGKELPLIPSVGFILECVLLPTSVYNEFINRIADTPTVHSAGAPSIPDVFTAVMKSNSDSAFQALQDARSYWREIRTESGANLIQFCLFDALTQWSTEAAMRYSNDSLHNVGGHVQEAFRCAERLLHESAMVAIKMALYHLSRRHANESIEVIEAVRKLIAENY